MAKAKVDRFLDLVRRCGLVERGQLNRVLLRLKEAAAGNPITDRDFVGQRLVEAGLLTPWQCERLLEGRHRGFLIKNYKLLDHLGTGGMSCVYLAEHALMQRRVAIKVLPKDRVQDSSYLARFRREARAAAALDHRNIVRAYDVDHDGDIHYLVMEYVEGRDLLTMVKDNGPLDYAVAAGYIRQAAEGLAHAHAAGLIHRDVKPANLLVDRDDVVKLLDLGLARFSGEDYASLTVAHDEHVLGTVDYLAPEQALDSHAVDARADVYSLGCSLYFVLAGHPPFRDGTLPQRLMRHQKELPPSIYEDRPDAPDDLVEICLKMMAKQPDDRPQTMSEVARLLGDWLTAHGHSFDSGSGSGDSSGRLVGAALGLGKSGTANQDTVPQTRGPTSGGATPGKLIQKADTEIRRSQPLSPTASAGTGSERPAARGKNAEASDTTAKRPPAGGVADTQPHLPAIEVVGAEEEAGALDFLAQVESPAVARLRSGRQMTEEELEAYRRRQRSVPLWIWAVIGVGSVLALVLLVIVLATQ